ncbi:MAG TPA: hypothetical protein DD624_02570 [Alphaproteobacteria bacterium]|mgnify:CR=1 FL=1|nr:hypothetical protein [Alphaproteobacteria bacterium]
MELSKNQIAVIKAVGKACDSKSVFVKQFVFSDGRDVFATNAYIALYEMEVGIPKGAYFPTLALPADANLDCAGFSADEFIGKLQKLVFNAKNEILSKRFAISEKTKEIFDNESKKQFYRFVFRKTEDFPESENFFSKRLVKKALAFVGSHFNIYQNEPDAPAVFERRDGKRIAIIMPYFKIKGKK